MESQSETIPPTRLVLDLDEPLLRQALLEALDLLAHPPKALEKPGPERQWRSQVWVRCAYLLTHCSQKLSGNSAADLCALGKSHSVLAQRLLEQDRLLSQHWPR